MTLTVCAFGGGVQSTAILVLAARGEIDVHTFLFANVGADSENPDTLAYLAEHGAPFALAHGLELTEVVQTIRGVPVTLRERATTNGSGDYIPVFQERTGAPASRRCTWT